MKAGLQCSSEAIGGEEWRGRRRMKNTKNLYLKTDMVPCLEHHPWLSFSRQSFVFDVQKWSTG